MGEIWIPEAERLGSGSIGGAMDTPNLPPRAVWHTTESGAGDAAFNSVAAYLRQISAEPHILYDPTTDRLGQFGPLNQSARALKNDGSYRTNRTGRVCIQIEVLARASKPFTDYWRPGKNFRALMRAIRSWGIPDTFPAGALASSGAEATNRPRSVWLNKGGHYGHCHVPGNDHWDPGAISISKLFAAAKVGDDDMPKYVSVARNSDFSLKPGVWDAIEYDTIWTNEPGHLGKGGSSFVKGPARFTGDVTFELKAQPGTTIQARLSEVENGQYVVDHPAGEMLATDGTTFFKMPINGRVGKGRTMRVRLLHFGKEAAVVTRVVLKAHVWEE